MTRRTIAVLSALLVLGAASARAGTGEIGLDAAALHWQGSDHPLFRLHGAYFIEEGWAVEGQVARTATGDGDVTSAMVGLQLWTGASGELPANGIEASALVGYAAAEGGIGSGFAWQAAIGYKWMWRHAGVRVNAGYTSMDLDIATVDGPFVAAGVVFPLGW